MCFDTNILHYTDFGCRHTYNAFAIETSQRKTNNCVIQYIFPANNKDTHRSYCILTFQTYFYLLEHICCSLEKKNNRDRDAKTVSSFNISQGFMRQHNFSFGKDNRAVLFTVMGIFLLQKHVSYCILTNHTVLRSLQNLYA